MLKEQQHDVAVGVGLRQCEPYSTVCIYCCDERQSWTDSLHGYRADLCLRIPELPIEWCLIEPAFIDVDDATAFFQELYHFNRILLSKNKAALRITLFGHPLGQAETHVHILLHRLMDLPQARVNAVHLLDFILDLLSILNWNIILMQLADLMLNCFANNLFPLLVNNCDLHELRFFSMPFGEPPN